MASNPGCVAPWARQRERKWREYARIIEKCYFKQVGTRNAQLVYWTYMLVHWNLIVQFPKGVSRKEPSIKWRKLYKLLMTEAVIILLLFLLEDLKTILSEWKGENPIQEHSSLTLLLTKLWEETSVSSLFAMTVPLRLRAIRRKFSALYISSSGSLPWFLVCGT